MGIFRSSITALAAGAVCGGVHAATLFMGTYPNGLVVFDEAKGAVTDHITLTTGVPRSLDLSTDKSKIYVTTGTASGFEVVDVATHKVLTHFTLDTPRVAETLAFASQKSHVATRYRLSGGVPDPTGKYFYTTLVQIDKGLDRYTVSKPRYAVIDLEQHKVVRSRDVDQEEEQATANSFRTSMVVSPDGKYLYVFRDKVVVLNTADLKVVDRINLAQTDDLDLQSVTFGPSLQSISQPGEFVSLFDETDPYIHNRVMGIGRFNLDTREFSFTPIGPAPETMGGLQVVPDGKTAYAVVVNGKFGDKSCQFWRFDLATNTVGAKAEFPCRTRFTMGISGNGQNLYIYGAGFEIEAYDAKTLKYVRTWDLQSDMTGGGMIVTGPSAPSDTSGASFLGRVSTPHADPSPAH